MWLTVDFVSGPCVSKSVWRSRFDRYITHSVPRYDREMPFEQNALKLQDKKTN